MECKDTSEGRETSEDVCGGPERHDGPMLVSVAVVQEVRLGMQLGVGAVRLADGLDRGV